MKKIWPLCFSFFLASGSFQPLYAVSSSLLVDKKTNTIHLCDYEAGAYKIRRSYHATLGQVKGDKEDERDLKTPEGIYTFSALLKPPALASKFGTMAFLMNFPNKFDELAGRRGNGIMLHATNEPERLKKNYDSEGCIVVKNEEIEELRPNIRIGLTPILVFSELSEDYLRPPEDKALQLFFESWVKNWEKKDVDAYIDHYHSDFSAQGKNRLAWKNYKNRLNRSYASIRVGPEDVHYYRHPKYSMLTFTQNYQSKKNDGSSGHRSRGTKILYIAEENSQPKIIAETYTGLMW